MHYHNLHHQELSRDAKVQAIQTKVENLQSIMGRNISLVLDNQQRMEKLLVTSEIMREDAMVFRRKSRVMLKSSRRKNWCVTIAVVIVLIVVIFMATLGVCGTGFRYCRAAAAADSEEDSNYDGGQAYDNGDDGGANGGGDNANAEGNNNGGGEGNGGGGGRRLRQSLVDVLSPVMTD